MKLKSRNYVPHDGFYFIEGKFIIRGGTFEGTAEKLRAHRKSNGKPPGNPEEELETQVCQRNPELCLHAGKGVALRAYRGSMVRAVGSFINRMNRWRSEGMRLVPQEVASKRAEVCSQCPENLEASAARGIGCKTCSGAVNATVRWLRDQIIARRRTPQDHNLRTCAVCGCDNRLQAWAPKEVLSLTEAERAQYPTHCWKLTM